MVSTYSFSYENDFNSSFNQSQLHTEILNESGITKELIGVTRSGDVIDVLFETGLTTGEETILNTVVSNHSPNEVIGRNTANISLPELSLNSTIYQKVGTFVFPGIDMWPNITHIKVVSTMNQAGTSYDVRIYDTSNNNEIASNNFNNVIDQNNNLGTISNIPNDSAIFEIHVKVADISTTAQVKNVNIYYD